MEWHQLSTDEQTHANVVVEAYNNLTPAEQKWVRDHSHAGNHAALETWISRLKSAAKTVEHLFVAKYIAAMIVRKFPR